jgi:hypothetical protein
MTEERGTILHMAWQIEEKLRFSKAVDALACWTAPAFDCSASRDWRKRDDEVSMRVEVFRRIDSRGSGSLRTLPECNVGEKRYPLALRRAGLRSEGDGSENVHPARKQLRRQRPYRAML